MGYVTPVIIPIPEYPTIVIKQFIGVTPCLPHADITDAVPNPNPNNVVKLKN